MKPKFRGPNSYGIQTTNKVVTKFFTDNGFKSGCKTYTVRISEDIKSAPKNIQLGFIRGLFDTDGCIRFDKNRTLHYYYPRIEFGFASENLTNDLHLLFDKLEFKSYRWKQHRKDGEAFSICLAGFANLEKWIKEVKPANDKHNKRIELGLLNKSKVNLKKCSTNL